MAAIMTKEELIVQIQNKYPEIDNLSPRTWDEVAGAMMHLFDSDWKPEDAMADVFLSVSGQIRHDVSEGVRRARITNKKSSVMEEKEYAGKKVTDLTGRDLFNIFVDAMTNVLNRNSVKVK